MDTPLSLSVLLSPHQERIKPFSQPGPENRYKAWRVSKTDTLRTEDMKFLLATLLIGISASAQPTAPNQLFHGAADLDAAINQAVREDKIPGAVLLIGHDGRVVYRKAYGHRALLPTKEPMTVDTIFDIASLTKVVATTSCLMKLFEQGRIWLDDPVTTYLPEFQGGQSPITIRDLMTHFFRFAAGSGPGTSLDRLRNGYPSRPDR